MGNVKELEVKKTSFYSVRVQLDDSINLEDLDEMELYELIINNDVGGHDDFHFECKDFDYPTHILNLDDSGHPVFSEIVPDEPS